MALLVCACGGEDAPSAPACLDSLAPSCSPLYAPLFDNVYQNTLAKKCAVSGGACHGPSGGQGGLVMASPDGAYAELLGQAGDRARVKPGDARCSELFVRIDSPNRNYSMPPGKPLSAEERCSIRQWIEQGATR